MEAEHEMMVKELRQQLKRAHAKDSKQEDYVRATLCCIRCLRRLCNASFCQYFERNAERIVVFVFLPLSLTV